ncbi:MAG: phage holin family protein [Erysipelotrichales bacterium]|nr:phage holin family protein [Erysipelotrichales bacterium]MBQ4011224.1 phage holin family protein [Erysipelotrichales bacterium]
MKKIGWTLAGNLIALYILDMLFDGIIFTKKALLLMAVLLWVLNSFVKPVLKFLTAPLSWITFGLWHLVLNVLILYTAFRFVPGAFFASYGVLALAALVLGILNSIISKMFGSDE